MPKFSGVADGSARVVVDVFFDLKIDGKRFC